MYMNKYGSILVRYILEVNLSKIGIKVVQNRSKSYLNIVQKRAKNGLKVVQNLFATACT